MYVVSKKARAIIFVVFALILAVSIGLPLQSNVSETIQFSVNSEALFRQLGQDTSWYKWWPGKVQSVDQKTILTLNEFTFTVRRALFNTVDITTTSGSMATNSTFHITKEKENKTTLKITTSILIPHNPVGRIRALLLSSKLKRSYKTILASLSNHFKGSNSMYGIDIEIIPLPFEYVTAATPTLTHAPSVSEVYSLLEQVKRYIKNKGGIEMGFPLLHVRKEEEGKFFVIVAMPTDRELPESEKINPRKLLRGGHIVTGHVTGNRRVIESAKKQVELYIQDEHLKLIVAPYEYLITNRIEQPDSSKWITDLCYPVI